MKNFVQRGGIARTGRGTDTTLLMYRTITRMKIIRNIIIEEAAVCRGHPAPRPQQYTRASLRGSILTYIHNNS